MRRPPKRGELALRRVNHVAFTLYARRDHLALYGSNPLEYVDRLALSGCAWTCSRAGSAGSTRLRAVRAVGDALAHLIRAEAGSLSGTEPGPS